MTCVFQLRAFLLSALTVSIVHCSDPYGFNSVRGDLEESNALEESSNPLEESSTAIVLWSEPETPVHGVDYEPFSFLPQSPRKSHGLVPHCQCWFAIYLIRILLIIPSVIDSLDLGYFWWVLTECGCSCCRLMNLGNTCYMNVIIQCLYNLSSFVTGMERFFGPLMKPDAFEVSLLAVVWQTLLFWLTFIVSVVGHFLFLLIEAS